MPPFDGDRLPAVYPDGPVAIDHHRALVLGTAAGDCVARAIARSAWGADADWPAFPSVRSHLSRGGRPRRVADATM